MIIDNLPDIEGKWYEYKRSKIKLIPQNNLRASTIGFPCERYHYHSIKDWRDKCLHDEVLQSIFDEGGYHEKRVNIELQEMGLEVVEQQKAFQYDHPLITCHVDGVLRAGADYPYDVKTVGYGYDRINSIEDLLYSEKLWQRSYPAQLQMYLLVYGAEIGLFILKDKLTGRIKPIWAQIDINYCDLLIRRAERVYEAIDKGQPPEKINDFSVCKKCAFRHLCLPDITLGEGIIPVGDRELASLLQRREDLEQSSKEFKELDEHIKGFFKNGSAGEKLCGEWIIRVSEVKYKKKVPITYETKEESYKKIQIARI